MSNQNRRRIGPAGTWARASIGATLLGLGTVWQHASRWDIAGALVLMPAIALVTAVIIDAALSGSHLHRHGRVPWSGVQAAAAAGVVLAVLALGSAITFISPVDAGALYVFFGASMILASVLGYDGCEMLALPNMVLRRRDAIWCPLYSPLDAGEEDRIPQLDPPMNPTKSQDGPPSARRPR